MGVVVVVEECDVGGGLMVVVEVCDVCMWWGGGG